MITPLNQAREALEKLASEQTQAARLHEALERLRPLRSVRGFDTTIVEMINDAGNTNYTPKEKAKAVVGVIEAIFRLCNE